jgi:HEPN domain-containing protein
MTPEELRRDEAGRWLTQAAKDINAARLLASGEPSRSVFHCQQAAEKAAKAFLAFRNVPFRRTHDLDELGEQCASMDSTLAAIVGEIAELTDYAVDFRYPGVLPDPDEEEAARALEIAQRFCDQVRALVA